MSHYMPHGMCLLWEPWLLMLWAGSDALIFASYMLIPFALFRVMAKRKDLPHAGLITLFAGFILLCGITHALSIVTLWQPIYPFVGGVKLMTGIVSAMTAVTLFRLIPQLVAIPSAREVEAINRNLREEAAAHDDTLIKLREARDSLEEKVIERTRELEEVNAQLAIVTREAIHRSGNLLTVVSSLARQSARGVDDLDAYLETFTGRLQALAGATSSIMIGEDATSGSLEKIVRERVETITGDDDTGVAISGPDVRITSEAAQQISLAVHELVTNSLKYNPKGAIPSNISVTWSVETGSEPMFEFVWEEGLKEDNLSDFEEAQGSGFGSKLLMRVIPTVLHGEASRDFSATSFTYKLRAPLGAITADRNANAQGAMAVNIVDKTFGLD